MKNILDGITSFLGKFAIFIIGVLIGFLGALILLNVQ